MSQIDDVRSFGAFAGRARRRSLLTSPHADVDNSFSKTPSRTCRCTCCGGGMRTSASFCHGDPVCPSWPLGPPGPALPPHGTQRRLACPTRTPGFTSCSPSSRRSASCAGEAPAQVPVQGQLRPARITSRPPEPDLLERETELYKVEYGV